MLEEGQQEKLTLLLPDPSSCCKSVNLSHCHADIWQFLFHVYSSSMVANPSQLWVSTYQILCDGFFVCFLKALSALMYFLYMNL